MGHDRGEGPSLSLLPVLFGPAPLLLVGLSVLVPLGYLAACLLQSGVLGFPLDDAWIHQTYARNLARYGQFAYFPGQPSAGSTSPLWSLLLSLGYLLGIEFKAWAYALGILLLALTGVMVYHLSCRLFPDMRGAAPGAGLFCVLEWHMGWAAVSSMETLLFTFLQVTLLERVLAMERAETRFLRENGFLERRRLWYLFALGLLGGLLTLTRPEGLVLLGLASLAVTWRRVTEAINRVDIPSASGTLIRFLQDILLMGLGASLLIVPYLAWHFSVTGLPFPNTFYAKQQEYAAIIAVVPFPVRWLQVSGPTLVGAQFLLVPGALIALYTLARRRRWIALLPALWWAALTALYAWRLPVTYQHGRYLIPAIPILVIYGVGGTWSVLDPASPHPWRRILSRAAALTLPVVLLLFVAVGARAYAADVGFIEGEMAQTALWLRDNTPPDALIAVHDIGAVGYLADRPLLDLAGLVTPQVIPFITDTEKLLAFMQERGASYVVFFPDWSEAYRRLAQNPCLRLVYSTGYAWTRQQGHENMAVYALSSYCVLRTKERASWNSYWSATLNRSSTGMVQGALIRL
jgi:hypothetical protein